GLTRDIFNRPAHPYTIGLLHCLPTLTRGREKLVAIDGQPPDLAAVPPGCSFAPRCPLAEPRCSEARPELAETEINHLVACVRASESSTLRSVRVTSGVTSAAGSDKGSDNGSDNGTRELVLEARGLTKYFPIVRGAIFGKTIGTVKAVDGVDF